MPRSSLPGCVAQPWLSYATTAHSSIPQKLKAPCPTARSRAVSPASRCQISSCSPWPQRNRGRCAVVPHLWSSRDILLAKYGGLCFQTVTTFSCCPPFLGLVGILSQTPLAVKSGVGYNYTGSTICKNKSCTAMWKTVCREIVEHSSVSGSIPLSSINNEDPAVLAGSPIVGAPV